MIFDDGAFPIWKDWEVNTGFDDGVFPLGGGVYVPPPVPPPVPPNGHDPIIIWVSKAGNDTTGTGSQTNPYLTIERALLDMSSGDQIRILDGVYTPTYSIVVSGIEGSIFAENPGSVSIRPLNITVHQAAVAVLNSPRFYIFGINIIQSNEDSDNLVGLYVDNVQTFIAYTCAVSDFESVSGSIKGIFANAQEGRIENCFIDNIVCSGYELTGIESYGLDIIDCHVKRLKGNNNCIVKGIKINS